MFRNFTMLMLVLSAVIITSCSDDDKKDPTGPSSISGYAIVSTGGDNESNISVIDYINNKTYNDLLPVSGTCELQQYGSYVYIIDKEGDRIIKFDPKGRTAVGEMSTGPGSAPESIAFISATKAYATMSDSAALKIFNPTTMTVTGSIDLSSMADADGDPDQGHAVLKDGKVYVALRRSNGSKLTDHSSIAVINVSNNTVAGEIILKTNGIGGANKNSIGGGVGFSSTVVGTPYPYMIGSVSKATDGGIETLDTQAMSSQVYMSETEIGGNISNWVFDTTTTGWAIVGLSTASGGEGWGLKRFDLSAKTFTAVSAFQKSYYCWGIDYTSEGLVLVGSQDEKNPGVWVFDSKNGYKAVFDKPIDTGLLPERILVLR